MTNKKTRRLKDLGMEIVKFVNSTLKSKVLNSVKSVSTSTFIVRNNEIYFVETTIRKIKEESKNGKEKITKK